MDTYGRFINVGIENFQRSNYQKALLAFKFAHHKALVKGDQKSQQKALVNIAVVLSAMDSLDSAKSYLSDALDCDEDPMTTGFIHSMLGIIQQKFGGKSESAKEYAMAVGLLNSDQSSPDVIAREALRAGLAHMQLSKYARAISSFDLAIEQYSKNEKLPMLALVLCKKAKCLVASDSVQQATQICQESLDICKGMKQDDFALNLYNEIGLIFVQCQKFSEAYTSFTHALQMALAYDDEFPQIKYAALQQNIGAVCNNLGRHGDAVKNIRAALQTYGKDRIRSSQCHCFLTIAYSYAKLKMFEKCEESYLHALLAAKDAGSTRDEWQAFEGLAGISVQKGNLEKAAAFYKQAIGLCAATDVRSSEQERLVSKLSYVLRCMVSLSQHPALSPVLLGGTHGMLLNQHTTLGNRPLSHAENPGVDDEFTRDLPSPPESVPAQTVEPHSISSLARRSSLPNDRLLVPEPEVSRPQRRRKRSLRRRSDKKKHPIHKKQSFVYHGLGAYNTLHDNANPADQIVFVERVGQRRVDASSVHSDTHLHINGLAVSLDEPPEPSVSAARSSPFADRVDSKNEVTVRPMSRSITHRRSKIIDTDALDKDSQDFSDSSSDSVTQSVDCYDFEEESDDGSLFSVEPDDHNLEEKINGFTSDKRPSHRMAEKSVTESADGLDTVDKHSLSLADSQTRVQSAKGKRPLARRLTKHNSKMDSSSNKHSLEHTTLLESDPVENDGDRGVKGMKPTATIEDDESEMRLMYLHQLSEMSNTDKLDTSDYEPEKNGDDDTDNSNDLLSSPAPESGREHSLHETYQKPDGYKANKGQDAAEEPMYATIKSAETSIPAQLAPPRLPPRHVKFTSNNDLMETDSSDNDINNDNNKESKRARGGGAPIKTQAEIAGDGPTSRACVIL